MRKTSIQRPVTTKKLFKRVQSIYNIVPQERTYLYLLIGLMLLGAFIYPYREIAMWFAFFLAAYSAIANDSIQTIGTFISSNKKKVRWYYLWLFMGGIFVCTVSYSWLTYGGDISYERLTNKGLDEGASAI